MASRAQVAEACSADLADRFQSVRSLSVDLAAPLSDADATVQSMPDASPAKWHLAHTTWFFETFLLRDHVPGYVAHDDRWAYLFNSYYEAEGPRHPRPHRGLLTRPTLAEIRDYRARVDEAVLNAMPRLAAVCPDLLTLGLHHEQQHQELMLTDLKHLFSCNPLDVALWPAQPRGHSEAPAVRWIERPSGLVEVGHADGAGTFAFDNEQPRHPHYLAPHALANRPVSNGEWRAFMEDGGYRTASLWLSDGWDWLNRERIGHPLYWRESDGAWEQFSLSGWQAVDDADPVTHISFYEADAFASWSGARLPTEQELEAAAQGADPHAGIQLDRPGPVAPRCPEDGPGLLSLFGNVWEWTGSAYRPYPGFRTAEGAVGEYNGKFMSSQFVLKGGSCATPRGHMRASYRNFFHPHQRWQFTGLRLAKDC
ncbi:ergothioneine biosynthesis protein EgtB [Sphingobium sp. B2D3A]|uniref:ergothioneine biosynthesis protein EgtB n=1 Tax=unclassified Sphingobium TaxID=2611147 RepID=UPI002224A983|nr:MULTISPECIES: ergothioneine biosynthesis protein EgtB [unclassified Sphingobium]MCW2337872.1 ergothioneine biosynthesis protein EgtB [Sphingobium sp. B2D3A]MCW2384330.1 ergothioneine biosynthesis protein EgtB [Sphingobium sp. B2D3D]